MAFKLYNVTISFPGQGSRKVQIEATNPPQARDFAKARFPGAKVHAANMA